MTYTVRAGDTLSAIARAYNTTVHAIMLINPQIKNKNKIYTGQVIKLPGAAPARPGADPAAIGKQLKTVLSELDKLPSFNKLMEMIGND